MLLWRTVDWSSSISSNLASYWSSGTSMLQWVRHIEMTPKFRSSNLSVSLHFHWATQYVVDVIVMDQVSDGLSTTTVSKHGERERERESACFCVQNPRFNNLILSGRLIDVRLHWIQL